MVVLGCGNCNTGDWDVVHSAQHSCPGNVAWGRAFPDNVQTCGAGAPCQGEKELGFLSLKVSDCFFPASLERADDIVSLAVLCTNLTQNGQECLFPPDTAMLLSVCGNTLSDVHNHHIKVNPAGMQRQASVRGSIEWFTGLATLGSKKLCEF